MQTQYDAFISYRHVAEDIKIAKEIQRRLENMHVPKALQKQIGRTRINRIFRDKEELPITSDIAGDICEALENARFLIVICSVHTNESQWVRREIDAFLKTHDKSRVLTVLVNGEPQDVIPEVLTDGMEPLSCDYRGSIRRARQEELPRLAAAILGCRYDDLIRRQHRRRMRNLAWIAAGVSSLLLGIAGYYMHSNAIINESYRQTLTNQSKSLALQSEQKLAEGDRMLAVRLALAALPGNGDERPVVAEAQRALADAVNAYIPPRAAGMEAAYRFDATGAVRLIAADELENGGYFCYADDRETVYIWNTDQFIQTAKLDFSAAGGGSEIRDLVMTEPNLLYVVCPDRVVCIDCGDGSELWGSGKMTQAQALIGQQGGELLVRAAYGIYIVDSRTGGILEEIGQDVLFGTAEAQESFDILLDLSGAPAPDVDLAAAAPDGSVIYCAGMTESGWSVNAYDRRSGESRSLINDLFSVWEMACGKDGRLFLLCSREERESSYDVYAVGQGHSSELTSSGAEVLGIASDTGKIVWESSVSYWVPGGMWIRCASGLTDAAGLARDAVIVGCGNILKAFDAQTGRTLHHFELPGGVLDDVYCGGDGISELRLGLDSGELAVLDLLTGKAATQTMFDNGIRQLICRGGEYFAWKPLDERDASEDDSLICYNARQFDGGWQALSNQAGSFFAQSVPVEGGVLVYDFLAEHRIALLELNGNKSGWTKPWDSEESPEFLGLLEETRQAVLLDMGYDESVLTLLSLETGEASRTVIAAPFEEQSVETEPVLHNGKVHYIAGKNAGRHAAYQLVRCDAVSGQTEQWPLPLPETRSENADIYFGRLEVSPDGSRVWFSYEGEAFQETGCASSAVLELSSGELYPLQAPCIPETASWSEDGAHLMTADGAEILLFDAWGGIAGKIPYRYYTPVFVTVFDDSVLVVGNAGTTTSLYRYERSDGRLLGVSELLTAYGDASQVALHTPDEETFVLQIDGYAVMVSREQWVVTAVAEGVYSKYDDVIFARAGGSYGSFGYFRRYSLEDLIAAAQEMLSDQEFSPEILALYGIG